MARLTDVAAKIEREAEAKLARGSVVLELPVYGGRYAARYGLLGVEALDAFQETLDKLAARDTDLEAGYEAGAQFIADACRAILARSGEDDKAKWEDLAHDDGRPVLFDEDFAAALKLTGRDGVKIDSAVACVQACWVTQNDDGEPGEFSAAAFTNYAGDLYAWMQDTRLPVVGEIVGGLPGGRK